MSGPHMPAQCRLPARPRRNAVQSAMLFRVEWHDGEQVLGLVHDDDLFVEIVVLCCAPLDAHLPETREQRGGVDDLSPGRVDRQRNLVIKGGVDSNCLGLA